MKVLNGLIFKAIQNPDYRGSCTVFYIGHDKTTQ